MTGWRGTQGFSPLQTSTGDTEKLWQSAREGEPSLPCQAPLSWDGSGRARGQRAEQSRAGHTPHNRLRAAVPPPDETEIGTNTQTMPEQVACEEGGETEENMDTAAAQCRLQTQILSLLQPWFTLKGTFYTHKQFQIPLIPFWVWGHGGDTLAPPPAGIFFPQPFSP